MKVKVFFEWVWFGLWIASLGSADKRQTWGVGWGGERGDRTEGGALKVKQSAVDKCWTAGP